MSIAASRRTRLLYCGVLAGPIFVSTFTAHGATLPGYEARRHPVSSLALGPHGWIQRANFLVAGCLYGALAVGLWHSGAGPAAASARLSFGAAAVGLLGAGTFTTDPVSGYPPGTPDALPGYSGTAAALHDLLSVPTFLGLPAAAAVYAPAFARNGRPGWAFYSRGTAALMLTAFGLASAAFTQTPALLANGGLYQRTAVTTGFAWPHCARRPRTARNSASEHPQRLSRMTFR
jgi:Protein of unknown function (DUF998)